MDVTELNIALWGVLISVIALAITVGFNARAIYDSNKMKTHDILNNLDSRFNEAEIMITDTEERQRAYLMSHFNLGVFMVNLINSKVIKKETILGNYKYCLETAYFHYSNILPTRYHNDPAHLALVNFCKENNVEAVQPKTQNIDKLDF